MQGEEVGLQIAPMIDITLLLLFFFMLSNAADSRVSPRSIAVPEVPAAGAKQEPALQDPGMRVVLDIDAAGGWFCGERPLEAPDLPALFRGKHTLLLRADAQTPARIIQQVVLAAAEAGVQAIEHTVQNP